MSLQRKILPTLGPAEVKALGREVKNFDQEVWDANCDGVIERANLLEFSQDQRLKEILLGRKEKGDCGDESE